MYGSPGYPFSDERLAFLDSEYKAVAKQPSLKTLLVSAERDYVISNRGEKVPIESLEDKVVALYFYEDCSSGFNPTKELVAAYQELAENNKNFEVVLIYLTDTLDTCKCTNEDTFKTTFKTMPWLALPFKDPVHKKLKRLFDYPPLGHPDLWKKTPCIVIIGPHCEYIEPCGAEVLLQFGVSAYPFTRENLVISETKDVMDLKLEMMCSPTAVFKRIDGSQVQFSYFVGKRVIFYFESAYWHGFENLATVKEPKFLKTLKETEFLKMLRERYLKMKGTCYEFEVIYVPCDEFFYNEQLVVDMSWFVSPVSKFLPGGSALLAYYGELYFEYDWAFLLAFDGDGKIVRRTVDPVFKHVEFPFYGGTLEDEAYYKLSRYFFSGGYWNRHYEGLLRNSFSKGPWNS